MRVATRMDYYLGIILLREGYVCNDIMGGAPCSYTAITFYFPTLSTSQKDESFAPASQLKNHSSFFLITLNQILIC